MIVHTPPRELPARWVKAGDQLAVLATHYDTAHSITPVRTIDLARVVGLVAWVGVDSDPQLTDPAELARRPLVVEGYTLALTGTDGQPVELYATDKETVVVREAVEIEPWETVTTDRMWQCMTCADRFGTLAEINAHLEEHPAEPAPADEVPDPRRHDVVLCGVELNAGFCYLPAWHQGGHDADAYQDNVAPEQVDTADAAGARS